jgi:hypothetical protein
VAGADVAVDVTREGVAFPPAHSRTIGDVDAFITIKIRTMQNKIRFIHKSIKRAARDCAFCRYLSGKSNSDLVGFLQGRGRAPRQQTAAISANNTFMPTIPLDVQRL